jgi:hypothetical protein
MRPALLALAAFLVTLAFPYVARADAPAGGSWEEWRAAGDGVIAVRSVATAPPAGAHGPRQTKVTLARLTAKLAPVGDAIAVYEGPVASTALGVRDGAAAVVLFRGGAQPFVKVALVDLATRGVRVIDLARTAGATYTPSAAAVCADPDGFTVLWQEQVAGNPQAEARSTFARVKADGSLVAAPAAVPVPWALGAIVDDGRGYTLAVSFDGAAPDQTRLCFVTLSRVGLPEQHPWWGSRAAVVEDVQLISVAGRVTAGFRSGGAVLSVVADKDSGQWGKEAAASRTLVSGLTTDAPWALRVGASGVEALKK